MTKTWANMASMPTYDRQFFLELTKNDEPAASFCLTFLHWTHNLDDGYDRDKDVTAEFLGEVQLSMAMEFALNPFFQAHKERLLPLIVQGAAAWIDSVTWATKPAYEERVAADVLKSQYGEVFWHVAYLAGGWAHMREQQRKHRLYDFDAKPDELTSVGAPLPFARSPQRDPVPASWTCTRCNTLFNVYSQYPDICKCGAYSCRECSINEKCLCYPTPGETTGLTCGSCNTTYPSSGLLRQCADCGTGVRACCYDYAAGKCKNCLGAA